MQAGKATDLSAILLGLSASVAGILVGGLFDHYFFNLDFPHSVSIFWLFLGLTAVTINISTQEGDATGERGVRRRASGTAS
jgi:polysaccharide biosynthesis protein PslJ